MAINKKLIHFNTFENFNSKKLSANTENTQYTIGINGSIQTGSPDILYQSIVYIKDTKQQWTHGQLYSGGSNAYQLVNHGTSDTTFTLTPNTFHVWGTINSLTLTIGDEIAGVANEYMFQFTSGSEPTTLILPDSIKFSSDFTIEENKIYQISILNGLGTVMSWIERELQNGGISGGSGH